MSRVRKKWGRNHWKMCLEEEKEGWTMNGMRGWCQWYQGHNKIHIFRWKPLPQDEVLKRAHEQVFLFSLSLASTSFYQMQLKATELTSNEHFALECRYGENWKKLVSLFQSSSWFYSAIFTGHGRSSISLVADCIWRNNGNHDDTRCSGHIQ